MKKKFITFTLAGALMASALGSFAGSREPLIKVERSGEQGIHLYMDDLDVNASLTIYDRNRVTLFKGKTDKLTDISKRFDMSQLPDGSYTLEVEYGNRIKVYAFSLENKAVSIAEECGSVYKPTIKLHENKRLDVSFLNLDEENVEVELYRSNGDMLVEQSSSSQVIMDRFDVSRLSHGNYQIIIRTSDRVFIDSVNL